MATQHDHIGELWKLYLTDRASPEQVKELLALLKDTARDEDNDQQFHAALADAGLSPQPVGQEKLDDAWQSLLNARMSLNDAWTSRQQGTRRPFIRWYWAAASIILVAAIGVYFWTTTKKNTQPPTVVAKTIDIAPGKNGAVLTLANGTQTVLDSLHNGLVATQNGANVHLHDGTLTYDANGSGSTEVTYNTMTTPRGRQFQLVLPDGTKAWLNAASSITYPTLFNGKAREVSVTGEVYFEVVKNAKQPFIVQTYKDTITVLGTKFNTNTYTDESTTKTSLLEGSVKINHTILKPGEAYRNGKTITTDLEQDLAWKNGYFSFNDADIETVMRQLSRWYDVDIQFQGQKPSGEFTGELGRSLSLVQVMGLLGSARINYTIDNKTIIILPEKSKP